MTPILMNRSRQARVARAFTLVEILIVVAILGILSTIVVPQISINSRHARVAQVATQLQKARTQVSYFKAREGEFPESITSGTDWSDLLDNGYFPRPPRNSLRDNATGVMAGNGGPGAASGAGADVGWYWCTPLEILYAIDDAGVVVDPNDGLQVPGFGGGSGPYVLPDP